MFWCCEWKINELLQNISQKYADLLKHLQINIVVFDGYSQSRNATHKERSRNASQTLEITDAILCPQNKNSLTTQITI